LKKKNKGRPTMDEKGNEGGKNTAEKKVNSRKRRWTHRGLERNNGKPRAGLSESSLEKGVRTSEEKKKRHRKRRKLSKEIKTGQKKKAAHMM